ncbi:universal stress protein [Kitasatospora sp. NBC_01250]|uniref:universal stress protein n=1 Tax=unclassified Kitasatospora TaxID=2633591 RepID=UPI002E0F6038|nr:MULTISPECIES: universal stress protein [unclassified Kitasatospora]WSJ71366.1 universal stress protein [Kitasatospora sp. NBC_01302]
MSSTVRQVVVGVDGSAGSLAALRLGAEEAERHGVPLRPVLALVPPGGEAAEARWPSPPEYRRIWLEAAGNTLAEACARALGERTDGLEVEPEVVRGSPGPVLVDCACDSTDLLVLGDGGHGVRSLLHPHSVGRYCRKHAHGPVLLVHPAEVDADVQ